MVATSLSVRKMMMVALMIAVKTIVVIVMIVMMVVAWILLSQCFLVEVDGNMEAVVKGRVLSGLLHLKPLRLQLVLVVVVVVVVVMAVTVSVISSIFC